MMFTQLPRPLRHLGLALTAALLAWPVAADVWQAEEIRTSIYLRKGPAASLGLALRHIESPAPAFEHNLYSASRGKDVVFASLGPFGIGAEIENGHLFTRLAGGAVSHRGGFDLVYPGGSVSLQGFVLASASEPRTFEIRTAQGEVVFTGNLAHFELHPEHRQLQVFNVDLRISEQLAARLGSAKFAGMAVGVLALDARLIVPALPVEEAAVSGIPGCSDWTGEQDVALLNLPSVGQSERDAAAGLVSISPSAALKNVGTANVPWYTKFTGNHPPYNNSQHPFLVWSLFRIANGRLEQLGISDVKHAFLTINNNCSGGACTDNHILGIGCEDIYGEGNNEDEFSLSYRQEVTAHSGTWESLGSHFDQDNNNSQDHPPNNPDPFMGHRMVIRESDLQTAGATYYLEGWYVVRDDINIFNSMGYRRITPALVSGTWTFGLPNAFVQGSALDAWVDPNNPGTGNATTGLDTGVGHLRVAVKTTDLGNGSWRYDYVLVNHDFDRQVGSFAVPIGPASLSSVYFRDLDTQSGNDWQATQLAGSITGSKVGGQGLDWGVAYNFGFVANAPPVDSAVLLEPVETGSPASYAVVTKAPADSGAIFHDGFETGATGAWSQTVP